MKKTIFLFIAAACIIAECTATKTAAQSVVRPASTYNTNLVIPPSGNTKKPMIAISSISSFDQIFSNLDPSVKNIKGLNIASASIESGDPLKKNLGMFKSIKMYLSKGDGSNEVLIASSAGISPNAGSNLVLDLNKSVIENRTIKSDKINPNSSIGQSISGQLAGVEVLPSGEMRIRGVSTNQAGASPLYVIDGIERSSVQGLNPGDIESIEVLKDAGQTAVYGMRGANGVILVKTKSGNSDSGKKVGSLDDFVKGSTICVRLEYILRYPLTSETGLNVNVNFRTASNGMR